MQITIIRHGMTEKRLSGQDDLDRPLMKKCEEFIPRLGEFDAVFSSPARRCIETANLASGNNPIIVNALSTHLWNGEVEGREAWELIEKCYYLPSGEMAEVPFCQVRENMSALETRAWSLITETALQEITSKAKNTDKILIASHQFHVQVLALAMMRYFDVDDEVRLRFINNMYFAPATSIQFSSRKISDNSTYDYPRTAL